MSVKQGKDTSHSVLLPAPVPLVNPWTRKTPAAAALSSQLAAQKDKKEANKENEKKFKEEGKRPKSRKKKKRADEGESKPKSLAKPEGKPEARTELKPKPKPKDGKLKKPETKGEQKEVKVEKVESEVKTEKGEKKKKKDEKKEEKEEEKEKEEKEEEKEEKEQKKSDQTKVEKVENGAAGTEEKSENTNEEAKGKVPAKPTNPKSKQGTPEPALSKLNLGPKNSPKPESVSLESSVGGDDRPRKNGHKRYDYKYKNNPYRAMLPGNPYAYPANAFMQPYMNPMMYNPMYMAPGQYGYKPEEEGGLPKFAQQFPYPPMMVPPMGQPPFVPQFPQMMGMYQQMPMVDVRVPALASQILYYFSPENLKKDEYLKGLMGSTGGVKLSALLGFKRVKILVFRRFLETLTPEEVEDGLALLRTAITTCPTLELIAAGTEVRVKDGWEKWVQG